jgi:hypothetical protein
MHHAAAARWRMDAAADLACRWSYSSRVRLEVKCAT